MSEKLTFTIEPELLEEVRMIQDMISGKIECTSCASTIKAMEDKEYLNQSWTTIKYELSKCVTCDRYHVTPYVSQGGERVDKCDGIEAEPISTHFTDDEDGAVDIVNDLLRKGQKQTREE